VLSIVTFLALAACSGGGKTSSGGGQTDEVPQVTGGWNGSFRIVSGGPACQGVVRLTLDQQGFEITGTYSVTLVNCGIGSANGALKGAWAAQHQRFVLTDDEGARYELTHTRSAVLPDGSWRERLQGTVTEGSLVSQVDLTRVVRG
jgi:hypothetical protein